MVKRFPRIALWTVVGVVVLVALFYLFEWGGNLLDSGGTVGG
jgi:hypothetical protein